MCFYMCDVSATETAYHLNLEGYLATVEHYAAISETREVFGHILYDWFFLRSIDASAEYRI